MGTGTPSVSVSDTHRHNIIHFTSILPTDEKYLANYKLMSTLLNTVSDFG